MSDAVITLSPGQTLVSEDGREWVVSNDGELIEIVKGRGPNGESD